MKEKLIGECTIEEILFNRDYNMSNEMYLKAFEIVGAMYDAVKDMKEARGKEMQILNEAWIKVKPRVDKSILNASMKIRA